MRQNIGQMFLANSVRITVILVLLIVTLSVSFAFRLVQQPQHNPTPDPSLQQACPGHLIRNPIVTENQLRGTTSWQITDPAHFDPKTYRYSEIEGYAWTTSAEAGGVIKFSVSTNAPSFTASIYRLGWYQGTGGRLVQSVYHLPGHFYPVPQIDLQTGRIEATWPVAFTLQTTNSWVSGIYLVKLTASTGFQSYIPVVIRSCSQSNFAFIHAVNTDEAYNYWGGASLYVDYTHTLKAQRAYEVSFGRPFEHAVGAGQLFWWEYPMVRWLERRGYDVSYFSDVDMQINLKELQNHHALLIVGHSEYWSKQMRDNLETLVNHGINLAVFGGNDIFWQIRYESQTSDPQSSSWAIIACYKDARADPFYGKDNSELTVEFRNSLLSRPEQTLLGSDYGGWWDSSQPGFPLVIADASNWVFTGTGLKNGDSLPGLVGNEYDRVNLSYPTLPGLVILSASPVIDHLDQHDVSNATLYTASSGARVFNAGTFQWSWGLDDFSIFRRANVASGKVQKITDNILHNFQLSVSNYP
jgi:hypothetical protein